MGEESEAHSVDFLKWIEKGWWTSQEAFCVFMGHPPQEANDEANLNQLKNTDEGRYLIELIGAAEVDRSVEGLVFAKPFYFYRASCKAWLEWALTKSSIEIIPELLQIVGIDLHKVPRSQLSYRPKDEEFIKDSFIASAKIALFLCAKARLKDIKEVICQSQVLENLPSDRTLRKWVAQEGIVLNDNKRSDLEIAEIERTLKISTAIKKDISALTSTLKS